MHCASGDIIGPPADKEYAVEPAGVLKIIPSALIFVTSYSSTETINSGSYE